MTQLEMAREGQISDLVRQAATVENIDPEILRQKIAAGTAVVCRNNKHTNGRPVRTTKASTKSWKKPRLLLLPVPMP